MMIPYDSRIFSSCKPDFQTSRDLSVHPYQIAAYFKTLYRKQNFIDF